MTLALAQKGAIPRGHPAQAREHLATMLLLADEEIARAFVAGAPEAARGSRNGCSRRSRPGSTTSATRHGWRPQLHVHPQTVRYRLGKLRELLGDALERADQRFELELALRVRRALSE